MTYTTVILPGCLVADTTATDELVLELVAVADDTNGFVLSVLVELIPAARVVRKKTKNLSVVVLPILSKPALTDNGPATFVEMTVV